MKKDVTTVKKASTEHEKKIYELQCKLNEAERYKRRWNLRLYGLAEQEGEDIKKKVIDICCSVLPEAKEKLHSVIDVVHRLGRRNGDQNPRATIMLFTSRSTKELLWKKAKKCEFLKNKKLRFGEDLTTMDKDTRNQLWPQVQAARKEGRTAYFVGARAFVEGKEIRLMDT